jgi:hypothetical protein
MSAETRWAPSPGAHHQNMFVGVSLNAQGLFDWLLGDRPSRGARITRKLTHAGFEVFNLPFTSHDFLEHSHSPSGQVMSIVAAAGTGRWFRAASVAALAEISDSPPISAGGLPCAS